MDSSSLSAIGGPSASNSSSMVGAEAVLRMGKRCGAQYFPNVRSGGASGLWEDDAGVGENSELKEWVHPTAASP